MRDPKTVLILGGGVGGIVTAHALRRRLGRGHRIVLVDREAGHLFAPSLLWLMIGRRTADAITRPLQRLSRRGIEVRIGTIERIDPRTRTVTVDGDELAADYVVISLGAELAPAAIPGLAEAGHNFYTRAGAESFRDALAGFRGGRIVILTAAPAYKCPAAPYEAALLIESWTRKAGIRDRVQLDVYAAEPAPMGVAGPDVSAGVVQMLTARGITYHPAHQITSANAEARRLTFADGAETTFDLLAYVPPHRAPAVVRDSGLTGESGWMSTDRHTLETRWPGVYAIGDVVSIPLALGKPLPKAGVFAHRQADVVAENIAHEVEGRPATARFDGHGECFVETGGGKAGFGSGNFYAEPKPAVRLRPPARRWHVAKVLFEKGWLYRRL